MKGYVKAVCISKERGTVKQNVKKAVLKEQYGLEGDAHAGKWHRQVSLLSQDKVWPDRVISEKIFSWKELIWRRSLWERFWSAAQPGLRSLRLGKNAITTVRFIREWEIVSCLGKEFLRRSYPEGKLL